MNPEKRKIAFFEEPLMVRKYQICTRCIMDTSDPEIVFDENGVCNHCRRYTEISDTLITDKEEKKRKLKEIIGKIKLDGKNNPYNCIIGVSGGVDSTFTAYKAKQLGLRPLAVHLDNGWDSELAVSNIEKTLKKLDIDLYTYVLDWEEFKDLQLSFLKASTPDSEIPTDHAIMALLYQITSKNKLKYMITGYNIVTEGIIAKSWSQGHFDWKYIKSVQKRFGSKKLNDFLHFSLLNLFYYQYIKRIKKFRLLNYIDYNKAEAIKILQNELGWVHYGGKHYESIYTRFFQGDILPKKFNYDKRRGHLSTLILSEQLSREEALEEIEKNPYSSEKLNNEDRDYVIKKLGIDESEFKRIMTLPKKSIRDYPSSENGLMLKLFRLVRRK